MASGTEAGGASWPDEIFAVLEEQAVRQVAFVPDAGHARLIERCAAAPDMEVVPLTSEEQGVALLAGAWLGGARGVLLMQSSGLGNCINMLSLVRTCRFPLLMLVTMRGEAGEFNPWQVPMGSITADVLRLAETTVHRVTEPQPAASVVERAAREVFEGSSAAAVLISQRVVGVKTFDTAARKDER